MTTARTAYPTAGVARPRRRVDRRTMTAVVVLIAVGAAATITSLALGDLALSVTETVRSLLGTADESTVTVVREWRLPRAAAALVFGAALALAGAVFQTLTRNPLASPDLIGFSTGSYTGALAVLLLIGGGYGTVALGAVAGGLLTALVVYALSYRRGLVVFRLIIVGVAVSAMLGPSTPI